MKQRDYALKEKIRDFLESLTCSGCRKRDLFGDISCITWDKKDKKRFLAWCDYCEFLGIRLIEGY